MKVEDVLARRSDHGRAGRAEHHHRLTAEASAESRCPRRRSLWSGWTRAASDDTLSTDGRVSARPSRRLGA